ncbi:putative RNA recognition motif domain, nucleotide-binding alpha-beta plait domain superfamily [Helianthus annuus]|nr:putative RNA recognition motif domain, nucleotide-binding alpha-beta plait domain superfamily [Helianthus annuus]
MTKYGGGEQDTDGPWHDVQYRKNSRSRGDGVEWSFLVQNISEKVTRNVLWRAFRLFGFVSDVYVAQKRDSRGRCFGFVRYVGVENMKETLAAMNSVRMFDMKVIVSLAKYDKDHKKITYAPDIMGRSEWGPKDKPQENKNCTGEDSNAGRFHTDQQTSDQGPKVTSYSHEGRSYADALRGNKVENSRGAKVVTVDGKGSLYPIHCIGRSILGYAREVMTVSRMRKAIEEEGMSEVGLSYVGGVAYILTFRDKVYANMCMELHFQFFNKIFSKYQIWMGEDIPFSRLVTLTISGVPFIIRDNSLFDNIGGLFGDVVQKSSFSWQEEDNSMASVRIITSQPSRIDEAVVIKWNNRTIAIWVSESVGEWKPELDDVTVVGSQDYDSETGSDSDMESVGVEDLEDGEIRQGMDDNDCCQEDAQVNGRPELGSANDQLDDRSESSPVNFDHVEGNKESSEGQPTPRIIACGESQRLHGDSLGETHGQSNNEYQVANLEKAKIVDVVGPDDALMDAVTTGPNKVMPQVINSGPNVGLDSPLQTWVKETGVKEVHRQLDQLRGHPSDCSTKRIIMYSWIYILLFGSLLVTQLMLHQSPMMVVITW